MNSRDIEEKKNNKDVEVTRKYRKVFLSTEDGLFVLTDILNELGDFSYRSFKSEEDAKESIIKSNISKLILWKLGVWRTENATKIPEAMVKGFDEGKSAKSIIRKIIRLPWKYSEEENNDQ